MTMIFSRSLEIASLFEGQRGDLCNFFVAETEQWDCFSG